MNSQQGYAMGGQVSPRPLTTSFKALPREVKATWGNKFIRDHYDLQYEADPESISNRLKKTKSKIKSRKPQTAANPQSPSPLKKYQYTPFKPREPMAKSTSSQNLRNMYVQGLGGSNYLKGTGKIQQEAMSTATNLKRKVQQQKVDQYQPKTCQQGQEGTNLYGLSRFQFNKTMKGRMQIRSNHHIDFQKNNTYKIDNRNKVWYAEDTTPRNQSNEKLGHRKIHSFGSYSAHKLFAKTKKMQEDNGSGWGGFLDKFYETTSPEHMKVNHEDRMKERVKYQRVKGRDPLQKKLGTNLDYNTQGYRTLQTGDGKRPLMQMSQSPRNLVFSRQVISPSRGCFR